MPDLNETVPDVADEPATETTEAAAEQVEQPAVAEEVAASDA